MKKRTTNEVDNSDVDFSHLAKSKRYQEVKCLITGNKIDDKLVNTYEVLKIIRPKVNIRPGEAEVLNRGVNEGGNTVATLYLIPDHTKEFTFDQIKY